MFTVRDIGREHRQRAGDAPSLRSRRRATASRRRRATTCCTRASSACSASRACRNTPTTTSTRRPAIPGQATKGKVWNGRQPAASSASPTSTGPRRSSPDQAQPYTGSFTMRPGRTDQGLSVERARRGPHRCAGRQGASRQPPLRRRQGGRGRRRLRAHRRHQALRPPDRLGLVLFHHQAAVQSARLLLPPVRQFRRRDPDRHGAAQDRVLPARQQAPTPRWPR